MKKTIGSLILGIVFGVWSMGGILNFGIFITIGSMVGFIMLFILVFFALSLVLED